MTGVIVDLLIGFALFTPIGFFVGYIQHKREKNKELKIKKNSSDNQK